MSSESAEHRYRSTYKRGIVNGIMLRTALALMGPATVTPLFLSHLTTNNWLIGLGSSVSIAGWFLPQIFGAHLILGMKRRLPFYRWMGLVRGLSFAATGIATAFLTIAYPSLLVALFFILMLSSAISGGLAGVIFLDIIGTSIPTKGEPGKPGRGSFFGWRLALSGMMGISIGVGVIDPILEHIAFPYNFALIYGLASLFVAVGVTVFGFVPEPPVINPEKRISLGEHLRRSFALVKDDKPFRRYLYTRNSLMLYMLGMPFYILYADKQFGLTPFWIGMYLSVRFAGEVAFNVLWAKLSDRGHNRLVMRGAALVSLLPPLICLAESQLQLGEVVFALVFFFSGGAQTGAIIGGNNFLLQHAPPDNRPMYIGVINSTLGVTMLSAALGGVIVDQLGYISLFVVVSAIAILTNAMSARLSPAGSTVS
ncbi:MFS transporter [Calditrichota bacterium]